MVLLNRNKTRSIVEGAIINGIFMIMLILAMYTPLAYILVFFLPVPFIIYTQRHDLKSVFITSLAALVLSFIIGGLIYLSFIFIMIIPGILMGVAYRKNMSAWNVIIRGTLGYVGVYLLMLVVAKYLFHINIPGMISDFVEQVNKLVQNNVDTLLQTMPPDQSAESVQQLETIKEALNQNFNLMKETISAILPSGLIIHSFMQALVNHVISRRVLKRLGTEVKALPPFQELHMPRWILYYYFIVLILLLIPDIKNYGFLYNVAMNGIVIFNTLLTVLGLAVAYKYWITRGWNRGFFIVLVLILLFLTPFHLFFLYIGIIELLFHLRKRFSEK